jgi:LysM repeat protein
MTPEQYISKYFPLAVEEMNRYKIPASITLAQGLIETESGNSKLATKANNHFGIKCKAEWTGPTHIHDDDKKNECFRAYSSAEESYRDHSIFLLKPRYSALFGYEMADYRSWAFGLKQAGYATNPNYPAMLIKFIEDYKLYQFDNFGLDKTAIAPPKTKEVSKPKLSKEELLNLRKALANNIDLIIIDESFDIYKLASDKKLPIVALMEFNDIEGEQPLRMGQNFFLQKKGKTNPKETHTVLIGESLYDISQIYGVNLKQLRKYNKMESWEQPYVGEIIYLSKLRDDFMKTRPFYLIEKERTNGNLKLFVPSDLNTSSVNSETIIPNSPTTNKVIKNDTFIPAIKTMPIEKTEPINTSNVKTELETKTNSSASPGKVWVNHIVKPKETIFRISKNYDVKPTEILNWNAMSAEQGLKIGQSLRVHTSYPSGQSLNAPVYDEIAPSSAYVPPAPEPQKPKEIKLRAPAAKTIDTANLIKPVINSTPAIRVEKIKMSDLYKTLKKDTLSIDTTIKRRIKLTGE